jgi:hypothetical protein
MTEADPGTDTATAVAKLQRRLDAVQALLAEERAEAAAKEAGRTEYAEVVALREDLAAAEAQLRAAREELAAIRASATWKAGLALKQAARPAVAVRGRALRTLRTRGRGGRS